MSIAKKYRGEAGKEWPEEDQGNERESFRKEETMCKGYKQLKEIKLQDILDLGEGQLRQECLRRLIDCGFIEEKKPEWERITLKDLHRIRPGVMLKRILVPYEKIIHVESDPYWSLWSLTGRFDHILVYKEKLIQAGQSFRSGQERESSINDLFDGEVYIQV